MKLLLHPTAFQDTSSMMEMIANLARWFWSWWSIDVHFSMKASTGLNWTSTACEGFERADFAHAQASLQEDASRHHCPHSWTYQMAGQRLFGSTISLGSVCSIQSFWRRTFLYNDTKWIRHCKIINWDWKQLNWEKQDPPAFTPVTSLVIMKSGMLLGSVSPTTEWIISSCIMSKRDYITMQLGWRFTWFVPVKLEMDQEEVFSTIYQNLRNPGKK
jgi:hypothetical protein